uniref:HMA domain-containing protein n=1 Tax=Oryza barthii TaxID=65489 RepID=A0A0D3H4F9_9ORYZ
MHGEGTFELKPYVHMWQILEEFCFEQKVEIKVPMVDEKKKSKVMQIISKQCGILSITADMEKGKVTVVGNDRMDVTDLTTVLRKKMPHTYVIIDTVTQVDEKKEKEEKDRKKMEEECKNLCPNIIYPPYQYPPYMVESSGVQEDVCYK